MFVRELLSKVCRLCNKVEVAKYIEGRSAENYPFMLEEEKLLLQALFTVESELAMEYLPIFMQEHFESDGFIAFENFKEMPIAIEKITDVNNVQQAFTVMADGVQTAKGNVKVTYCIYPTEKGLADSIQIASPYTRVLMLGVAAEYAMLSGQFELFNLLDKKYKDAIGYACRTKNGIMKMRRWL